MIYQSCSGCTETIDGHNTLGHPYDSDKGCLIGMGCHECNDLGYIELPDDFYDDYLEFWQKEHNKK